MDQPQISRNLLKGALVRIKKELDYYADRYGKSSFTAMFLHNLLYNDSLKETSCYPMSTWYNSYSKYYYFNFDIELFDSENYTPTEIRYFLDNVSLFKSRYCLFDGVRIMKKHKVHDTFSFFIMNAEYTKLGLHNMIFTTEFKEPYYRADTCIVPDRFIEVYPEWLANGDEIRLSIIGHMVMDAYIERNNEICDIKTLTKEFAELDENILQLRSSKKKRAVRSSPCLLPPTKKQKTN